MRKTIIRSIALAAVLAFGTPDVHAQGFFGKLTKGLEKGANAIEKGTKKLENLSSSLTADTTGTAQPAAADTARQMTKEDLLDNVPVYTVKKVIETDAQGDTLRNDDGTVRAHYLVLDKDDKVCDPNTAKKMINSRLKAYGGIIAKTGGGALIGAVAGGLLSKKKNTGEILAGAGTGLLAGLALSQSEIAKVKELNASLKAYRKTIEAYQKTFTEEGIPVDASIDLSNVDGIDFTKSEELTKDAAEVKAELAASKLEGDSLEDIDIEV